MDAAAGGRRSSRRSRLVRAALAVAVAPAVASWASSSSSAAPDHLIVGFNATTPALVTSAASVGVSTDVLYNGPPSPTSALGLALTRAHMGVVDASVSTDLYFWECHRTHTVAPPPRGQRNDYCRRDAEPTFDETKLLATVSQTLESDAVNPLVVGYWVLDDWPSWDGGSARSVLQQIHEEIESVTPGDPAICGFGASITAPGTDGWDSSTGENYSDQGCDMVGFYNYADTGGRASSGSTLDWSMRTLLPAMEGSLEALGWNPGRTPLLGIGQAWSGRMAGGEQPGLSANQIVAEASAFCSAGATSIGWYAWSDSGFRRRTLTPVDDTVIDSGIRQAVSACQTVWAG